MDSPALRRGASLAAAFFALLGAGACVSGSDIEGLHRHIDDVDKKVDTVAKQSSSKDEVARIADGLGKQSATLLRSNADLGSKFDDIVRELQTLAGKLEDANRRLGQLSQQIAETQARLSAAAAPQAATAPVSTAAGPGGSPAPVSGAPPASRAPSPADLFAQATADYQRGQYELARQGFQEYVDTYPKTDLSDDAAYWAGECYAAQKRPREAIGAFEKMIRLYPQSDKGAAAHLKKALAHLELAEKAQAIVELGFVVREYPGSDEAKSARQRLRALGSDVR
jgi:tol-pal system protein YbgF